MNKIKIKLTLIGVIFLSKLSFAQISAGIKANNGGVMLSTDIRINDYNISKINPIQIGFGYSKYISKVHKEDILSATIGWYMNYECTVEIEANYRLFKKVNNDLNNYPKIYYNFGFRYEVDNNISYEIKMGQSLLQIGVFYRISNLIKR